MSSASAASPDGSRSVVEGTVWVVTVGDELLAGDIADANLAFLARRCRSVGATVIRAVSVRDRIEEIAQVIEQVVESGAGACLVSGGLGPTTDDLTTVAIAKAAGVPVRRDEAALQRLRDKFRAFGRPMPPTNEKQADFPEGAEVLANPIGSAEGFAVSIDGCRVFSMPGVPRELRKMTDEQVLPRLLSAWSLREVPRRIYRVLGHGESSVAQRIEAALEQARTRSPGLANMFVHYRASMPLVSVIVEGVAGADGVAATAEELATLDGAMVEALSPGLYGIGEADLATRIVEAAIRGERRLAVAESCTGGLLGSMITAVSGSSSCFRGGIISYDNGIKRDLLGVDAGDLEMHGAVSEPVARAMAAGARRVAGADLGIGITGIAGPSGGTAEKPVGTVHIAVCDETETTHKQLHLLGDRGTVRQASALWALKLVWDRFVAVDLARVAPMPE